MLITILVNLIYIWFFFVLAWIVGILKKDPSFIDVLWGPGHLVVLLVNFPLYADHISLFEYLYAGLILLWAFRLSFYLFVRNLKWGPDKRYSDLLGPHQGFFYLKMYFKIYFIQSIILFIVSFPIQWSFITKQIASEWTYPIIIGTILSIIGLLWETIADIQLFSFKSKSENKGKLMVSGLWALSRHPNYFGEFLFWWGIFIFGFGNEHALIAILGPIFLSYLLMKVSGVGITEKYLSNEKAGWIGYKIKVPAFIPFSFKCK